MNPSLRPPGGDRTWLAVVILAVGACLLWRGLKGSSYLTASVGGILLLSGVGLWLRFFRAKKAKKIRDDSVRMPPQPLTSLVLLLNGPRQVSAADVAIAVTRAWGGTYGFQDEVGGGSDKENWVVGRSPVFLIKSPDGMFMFHNNPAPYSPESRTLAQSIPDLRLRKAVEEHRAWVAVDLMQSFDEARPRESFYPAIGRLIAEVAGGDCLAVFHPASKRILAWEESLREVLRGPELLQKFETDLSARP